MLLAPRPLTAEEILEENIKLKSEDLINLLDEAWEADSSKYMRNRASARRQSTYRIIQTDTSLQPCSLAFLESIECPVCYEYLEIPIWTCQNKHLVCFKCLHKLDNKCPICRVEMILYFDNESMSNYKNTLVPCGYMERGCRSSCSNVNRYQHMFECDFQKLVCPLWRDGCPWTGIYFTLKRHCSLKHIYSDNENIHNEHMLMAANEQSYQLICVDDRFFVGICKYLEDDTIIWKVKPITIKTIEQSFWFSVGICDISRVSQRARGIPDEWIGEFWAGLGIYEMPETPISQNSEYQTDFSVGLRYTNLLKCTRSEIFKYTRNNVVCFQWKIMLDEDTALSTVDNVVYAPVTYFQLDEYFDTE